MQTGPLSLDSDQIAAIHQAIRENFSELNQYEGEVGTCKKMVPLKYLNAEWEQLAVVFSRYRTPKDEIIIKNERKYLQYLQDNNYPVVNVFGPEFIVQSIDGQDRYGMIEEYIPGVFIESKTPLTLKLLLVAGLLGCEARAQEAWVARNKENLIENIRTILMDDGRFEALRASAGELANNFEKLNNQFSGEHSMIADLQMIIDKQGKLTIIDPLDVVSLEERGVISFFDSNKKHNQDFVRFLSESQMWVKSAKTFCNQITQLGHASQLLPLLDMSHVPLVFSTLNDPRGKSLVNQLKTTHFDNSSTATRTKVTNSSLF